jgi:hypothetical protein
MKEQTDGACIRPLQVIHDQQQRRLLCQCQHYLHILLKEVALFQVLWALIGRQRLQASQPSSPARHSRPGPADQRRTGDEGVDQVWTTLHQGLSCSRDQAP